MECPICNGGKQRLIGEKNSFQIVYCNECKTVFADNTKSDEEYFDYSNYYEEENLNIPEFVFESYRNVIREFDEYRGDGRFLDVGCGAGTLLDIAREFDWDATGVEVSRPAVEHLKELGLTVVEGTLEDAGFPDDHFDVITCTEVIEHVSNPREVINEISRILRPTGILWITTPNSQSLSAKLLGTKWSIIAPPEHLNLFSRKSLKMCLRDAGFENIRFASTGFNPFEVYRVLRGGTSTDLTKPDPPKAQESSGFERVKLGYRLNSWFAGGKNKQKIKDLANFALTKSNAGDTLKVWARFK